MLNRITQKDQKKKIWLAISGLLVAAVFLLGLLVYGQTSLEFQDPVPIIEPDEQELAVMAVTELQEKPELSAVQTMTATTPKVTSFDLKSTFVSEPSSIPTAVYAQKKIDEAVNNILFVVDGRFYLISVCAEQIQVISIDPALLLPVQGYGWTTLTRGYFIGGIPCVINTLNQSFDLDITQYILLNSEGLWQAADRMGGLTVNLSKAEAEELNRLLGTAYTAGETTLWTGGLQGYTQLNVDGDTVAHWKRACSAMIDKAKEKKQLQSFKTALERNLATNVSVSELKTIGRIALQDANLKQYDFPQDGEYMLADGNVVLDVDLERCKKELKQLLYQ